MGFGNKIGIGLSRPAQKLLCCMLYGIAISSSCHLSKISRALREEISLKKTIERLSRGLQRITSREQEMLLNNHAESVKGMVDNTTIYLIDGSDICKPCSKALENLDRVRDGSTGAIADGYPTLEIVALGKAFKSPITVYDHVYSTKEVDFKSEDEEVLKGLRYVSDTYGHQGIRTMDRGYDAGVYYEYFIENREQFIIRAKHNRNVQYKGNTYNIMKLAEKFKGKYKLSFEDKNGKMIQCKISMIPITLPRFPNTQFNLVVVYGFGKEPMILLSNVMSDDRRLPVAIVKIYLMRWRIEEYFRFKKQQYGFEDFRVRSLNAIRALHRILSLLTSLISSLSEKRDRSIFVMQLIDASKRIITPKGDDLYKKFVFYALGDAFRDLLSRANHGIDRWLRPKPPDPQLSFLSLCG